MDEIQYTELELEQIQLEHDTADAGVRKYWERTARLKEQGLETMTKPVQHVLKGYVQPLSDGIADRFQEAHLKPGRCHSAVKMLYWAHADVLALQTLQTVLDSISRPQRFQTVAMKIAREVESELRFQAFESQKEPLFRAIQNHISDSPFGYRKSYRQKVLIHAANKYQVLWEPWNNDQLYTVGVWLLDTAIEHTGLVEHYRYSTNKGTNTTLKISPTQELKDWMENQHEDCSFMSPRMLPMLCPPRPWVNPSEGGYLTSRYRTRLVPTKQTTVKADYSRDAMPVVYDGVNWLQSTPWRVNEFVRETIDYLWFKGFELPSVSRNDAELPPPSPEGATPEERTEAKCRRREVRLENEGMQGRRIAVNHIVNIANQFKGRTIYFPHRLDFRGRIYPLPQYLSPQGSDEAKGLLEGAEGEVLTADGERELMIHTANCYGVDKVSFDDRVQWVLDNWDMIESIAKDPIEDRRWYDADGPFQFLAACDAVVRGRRGEPVHLFTMVDGSCNGIQHLAAMSRDEEAGKLVNLVPSDLPGDIYQVVADSVTELVEFRRDNPKEKKTARGKIRWTADEEKLYALLWLDFGITRSLAKRPTMILPYNGTPRAIEKYIDEHVAKAIRKTGRDVFGSRRLKACQWLTSIVGPAMRAVVEGPVAVMKWTQELARAANKAKVPLVWTLPTGFTVVQAYTESRSRRVQTRVGDRVYKLSLSEPVQKLDAGEQRRGLAPNHTHAYDAANLTLTLFEASLINMRMAAVHDSYGSHPNRMAELAPILRRTFVTLTKGRNVLEELRQSVADHSTVKLEDIEEPPPLGTLDIEKVMQSAFFFA